MPRYATVLEYFREQRLELARELLVSGDVTVSEAAYQIGHQSLGHFTGPFGSATALIPRTMGVSGEF
ncbi:helix-turn-helix domain-containing protein [Solidesulfovibrio alcoholivorans]|uniref:helix-turn-helix domain-containing protein n=1 Tax=Solidesulfovibrio alcoholivorans TaxID=81406 RepID=UPI000AC24306|nr:helix-turn-helix domain-containing protein [Solidesulfovibrio alcoholivorans]